VSSLFGDEVSPILHMPLKNSLAIPVGVGTATFTRASTASYIDQYDGLLKIASSGAPRFEADGILIEDTSTNICLQSEVFDNASWVKSASATATADQAVSPDGTTNADLLDISASNSFIHQAFVVTADIERTYSIYLRSVSGTGTWPINWHDGGTHHRELVTLTTTWQRFTIVFTDTTTTLNIYPGDSRIGTNTLDTCYAWGAQIEELAFASSYIAVTTTAVTRLTDNLTIDSDNMPEPASDYSFSCEFNIVGFRSGGFNPVFYYVEGESTRRAYFSATSGRSTFQHGAGIDSPAGSPIVVGTTYKYAATKNSADITQYHNGALTGPVGTPTAITGTKTSLEIGRRSNPAFGAINGHLKNFKLFNKTLTTCEVTGL